VTSTILLNGRANNGAPRQEFADKLASLHDEDFEECTEKKIWLSAYANNNPRSDYHWQADACYEEAIRRGRLNIYQRAWKKAAGR
jgi:hypothetical protein